MKATVFFLNLSDEQREEINDDGWTCPVGRALQGVRFTAEDKAVDSIAEASRFGLYERAVEMEAGDAESVWMQLQSISAPWTERHKALTDFPRSMDVGDLIFWEDGRVEMCASVGFLSVELGDLHEKFFGGAA